MGIARRRSVSASGCRRSFAGTRRAAPKPQGGDMRSRRLEARGAEVMAAFEEERDQTLVESCGRLAARGIATSKSALSRFFQRRGITWKRRPATRSSRTARTS